MKTSLRYSAWLIVGALTFARLGAAVESVKIEPTFIPSFNPALLARGITDGKAALVIDVSAEGQLTDWLVLGSTDPEIANYFIEALKYWTITPARIDGQPIAAQVELLASVTAQGVVLSRTGVDVVSDYMLRLTGRPLKYQRSMARDLDRTPVRLNVVAPRYAEQAAQQGVRGRVQVHFYIDEHGAVRMPAVEPGTHPYLAGEAVAAVLAWKFAPPTRHGDPVLVAASQEFDFSGAK